MKAKIRAKGKILVVDDDAAYASVDTAVDALKSGAYDYLVKPLDIDELKIAIAKALDHYRLEKENLLLKERLGKRFDFQIRNRRHSQKIRLAGKREGTRKRGGKIRHTVPGRSGRPRRSSGLHAGGEHPAIRGARRYVSGQKPQRHGKGNDFKNPGGNRRKPDSRGRHSRHQPTHASAEIESLRGKPVIFLGTRSFYGGRQPRFWNCRPCCQ